MGRASKWVLNQKKIVFSGVGKSEDELKIAISKKILLINCESESEAKLVNTLAKKLRKTAIGVHINYQNMLKLIGFVSGNKYN